MTAKARPSSRPTSKIERMFGCENCEIVFASRSKRWRISASAERCADSTLTATSRPSRVSLAR